MFAWVAGIAAVSILGAVSYTHLDVYKRQGYYRILSYGGTLSGNGLTLGTVTGDSQPAATIQSLTGDKQINLILGPSTTNLWNGNGAASATRAGGGNGTWSCLLYTSRCV